METIADQRDQTKRQYRDDYSLKNRNPGNSPKVLLIHPPVVRPCEPPPGLARLAGALARSGIAYDLIDANLEGLRWLCGLTPEASDTWTRRAAGQADKSLNLLALPDAYRSGGRYRQAVSALNRVLDKNGHEMGIHASLTDYQDASLSPARSSDLIKAFNTPETNLFFPYFERRIKDVLAESTPRVVGVSLNFLSQALCAFAIIGCLKRLAPDVCVVLGGGLVTSWLRQSGWATSFEGMVDHMVAGPGEDPLLAVLGKRYTGEPALPDYSEVASLSYLSPGLVLPYSASNGCYWRRCAFCPEKAEGNPYRPIPVSRVISQLITLKEKYRPALIHLTDNALSPALLKALSLNPPGVPWYGFARITPQLADPDFCMALKRSGCAMLQLGLESGSQKVLDAFGKGVDLTVAGKALAGLKQAQIATYVYLLFGTPWEKEEDAELTLDFTVRHCEEIMFLNMALFNLPAHGTASESLDTQSFYKGDLSLYRAFAHPAGWQRRDVRRFLDKKFKRHPAIAAIVRKDPPVFTSSHAPFFAMTAQ